MISINIDAITKKTGKNISQIARESGINRNTIQAMALGKVNGIRFDTVERLCKTYGLQIQELLRMPAVVSSSGSERKLYKQEGECVPFTLLLPTVVATQFTLPGSSKSAFGALQAFYKGSYAQIFWEEYSMRATAEQLFHRYSDRKSFDALYGEFLSAYRRIEPFYIRAFDKEVALMTEEQLLTFLEDLLAAHQSFWKKSIFIDAFDVGVDQELIEKIAKRDNLTLSDTQTLTTPSEMTFSTECRLALLRIADAISKHAWGPEKRKLFLETSPEVKRYRLDFDYVHSNYSNVSHISVAVVAQDIETCLADKNALKKELAELEKYEVMHKEAIARVVRAHRLKENPLWFFERLTIWREYRKKVNLMAIHVLDAVLERVESLTGIPKKYLQYLTNDEVRHVLRGTISLEELKARREEGVLFIVKAGRFEMLHGAQAASLLEELEGSLQTNNTTTVINGQVASQGYAKGVARIILDQSQFDRFNEGEILVTGMTRPEFVPLMKKAAAIVTNEGGITCHAAIVSRELGKPCIIGTKNATSLIPDGAMVEVRANHGTVRVL